jgi:hypothetical protein
MGAGIITLGSVFLESGPTSMTEAPIAVLGLGEAGSAFASGLVAAELSLSCRARGFDENLHARAVGTQQHRGTPRALAAGQQRRGQASAGTDVMIGEICECNASLRCQRGSVVFMSAQTAPTATWSAAAWNTGNAVRAAFTLKINPAVLTASASSRQLTTPGAAVVIGSKPRTWPPAVVIETVRADAERLLMLLKLLELLDDLAPLLVRHSGPDRVANLVQLNLH